MFVLRQAIYVNIRLPLTKYVLQEDDPMPVFLGFIDLE